MIKIAAASPNCKSTHEETLTNLLPTSPSLSGCSAGIQASETLHRPEQLISTHTWKSNISNAGHYGARRTPGTAALWKQTETKKQTVLSENIKLINLNPTDTLSEIITNTLSFYLVIKKVGKSFSM